LLRVGEPVSCRLEITAFTDLISKGPAERNQVLLFENVPESPLPVAINLFGSAQRMAWVLLGVVTLWIGGFDLIYACQDYDFDRQQHLHSIPARFGIRPALALSAICHIFTAALLAGLGAGLGLAWPFWLALAVTCGLLALEHTLVRSDDLSQLNLAFFNRNSIISICLFAGILGSLLL
jgi:4-hydroxybenzoate polyprenyltransferase